MQLSEAPSKQLQITVRRVDTVADLRASIAAELGAAVMSCNYYATTAVSEANWCMQGHGTVLSLYYGSQLLSDSSCTLLEVGLSEVQCTELPMSEKR